MERSGPNGPGGTGGTGGGPPGSADGETLSDESGVPARDPEPTTRIPTTRTVVLGGEEPHEDVPIELTEEPEEESAAPLIDDAGPLDPDEEAALGDLDLRATPPKPLVVSHPTPAVPTLSPGRRSSEPPSHAAYRATSAGSVIPVPPPFVPFPGVAPVAEGRPATHRAAVPFVPYGAAAAAPEERAAAHRPAVSPPPPPAEAAAAPAMSSPVAPTPAPAAAVPAPPAPVPRRASLSQASAAHPSPAPGGLPKVIISEDAFRPSQQPAAPAAPGAVPVVRSSPAFGVAPVATAVMPATVSATRTVPAFGLAPAAPLPRATPPAAAPQPAAGVPVAAPAPVSLPRATPPAAVLREATALEGEDVPPAGEAAAPEAAEDVAEIDAAEAAEEEPSEETAAPVVAPPVPPRRAATVELESRALEETTDPEIQPPTGEGIGVLDPMEALRAAEEAVQDVFAPPAPPRSRMGPAAAESTGDEEVAPPSHSIHLDAVASVISIPEDDIPRTRAVSAAIGSLPAEESLLEGPAATAAEPAAGSGAAEGSRAEHSEEIVDVDVQPVEAEEAPAAGATVEPVAVVVETPPRPSAAPARPKGRRRRRHGERRAWWEEIFDEEHIRSLPKYSAEQTRNELDFIERALGVAKTARILDLGCGDGRQAVELAHRGYEVVGLDLSLPMLARAGDAAQAKGVKINFIQGDMRDLRFEGAFDAVYCVGSTFGYFDDDTNQAVLSSVFRALKPGGRLLLGMTNRDYVTLNQPRSTWFQGDDRQYLEDTDFNFITSRLVVKRSWATSAGDQETVEYTIRLYSLHELGKILHAAGFRVIEVSGHVVTPGVFFGADSANLLLLAERP